MKKLLIAAIIAVVSTVTQAASINWGGAVANSDCSASLPEGTVAMLLWSEDAFSGAATKISGAAVGATADNGGSVVSTYTLTSEDAGNWNFSATYDNPGKGVDGYYAILLSDGAKATYMDMGQITGTGPTSQPSSLSYNDQWTESDTANLGEGGFTVSVEGVPEPTSALMLMLGVGLMALRRRHA